jgi:hypothetical protein
MINEERIHRALLNSSDNCKKFIYKHDLFTFFLRGVQLDASQDW